MQVVIVLPELITREGGEKRAASRRLATAKGATTAANRTGRTLDAMKTPPAEPLPGLDAFLAAEDEAEQPPLDLDGSPHRPRTRNRSRDKRKTEIDYLRQRARELEFQVQALTAGQRGDAAGSAASARGSADPVVRALFDMSWRSIATRQLGKRQRAEEENRRLKKSVTEKMLSAQRLQRLLLQSSTLETQRQGGNSALMASSVSPWTASDLELMEQFAREVAVEYTNVDTVLQNHVGDGKWLSDQDVGFACVKAIPFNASGEVLYLDLQSTSLIPFPFARVCDVAWKAVHTLFRHGTSCPVRDDDSRLAVKLPSGFCSDTERFEGYESLLVMKRFVEKKRMVLVWRTTCDDARQSETMITDETGWCVFEPVEPRAGAQHMSGTLVRGCVHVIPIAKETCVPQQPEEISALTRTMVDGLGGDLRAAKSIIEDLLLTEAMYYDPKLADP